MQWHHLIRHTQPREGRRGHLMIAQLILSDLQTSMGDDILHWQMIVCLRDGKEAVEHLKARYPEEASNLNVALDIKTKLGQLALQHQASAQHQHCEPI